MDPATATLIAGGIGAFGDLMSPSQQGLGNVGSFRSFSGLGDTLYNRATGQFGLGVGGQAGQLQNQIYQGAGGLFNRGFSFDPMAYTTQNFGELQQLLQPLQEQQRSNLENRLFAQGRLGSTGGATQQQALERAIGEQNIQAAMQAQQQGLAAQQQLLNMGRGMFETALTPEQMLLNQLQVTGGLAPRETLGGESGLDVLGGTLKGAWDDLRGSVGDVGAAGLVGGGLAASGALGATAQTGALLGAGTALPYVGGAILANEFAKRNSGGIQRAANRAGISGVGSLKDNKLWSF